jgi:hypothetical protein
MMLNAFGACDPMSPGYVDFVIGYKTELIFFLLGILNLVSWRAGLSL